MLSACINPITSKTFMTERKIERPFFLPKLEKNVAKYSLIRTAETDERKMSIEFTHSELHVVVLWYIVENE